MDLADDEIEVELTAEEAATLGALLGEEITEGTWALNADAALDAAISLADTALDTCFAEDGSVLDSAKERMRLLLKLSEKPGWRRLAASAEASDLDAALELARVRLFGIGLIFPEAGVRWLKRAYDGGHPEAAYELAIQSRAVRELAGFSDAERVRVLEPLALAGDPGAALELLYMNPPSGLSEERMIRLLEACAENSTTISEHLEMLRPESKS